MKRDVTRATTALGKVLLEEIDRRGWTITGLAREIGIGQPAMWQIIYNPNRMPRVSTLAALARKLERPIHDLVNIHALAVDAEAQPAEAV